MVNGFIVKNTITLQTKWEEVASQCFRTGVVGVMEPGEGTYTIFGRVTGYVDDPTWGRLILVERVNAEGETSTPTPEKVAG